MPKANRVIRAERPSVCPACGHQPVAEIQYGAPEAFDLDLLNSGLIVLGGCAITGDDPAWRCTRCGQDIYSLREPGELEFVVIK